ncbi:MAG: hypothetical protein IPM82_28080 [Saprospiraceae bacterium]|nr:hypothetical protein [Saprospiraceae bacterium]
MKIKSVFVQSSLLFVLFTCFGLNFTQAQTGAVSGAGGTVGTPSKVEYCDAALPKVEADLRSDANETCTTQYSCVECMERATKLVVAATVVVQPTDASCNPVKVNTRMDTDAALSRGGGIVPRKSTFSASILQSPCYDGGNNLEVYIAGYELGTDKFRYQWVIDGEPGGTDSSANQEDKGCVNGTKATVKVTQLSTGASKTLEAILDSGGATGGK